MATKTAREIMSDDCTCIGENDTVLDAARRLAELDVGALPICGEDDRLKGGAGDGQTVTIGADDSVAEALHTMAEHQVRRVPVIDGRRLVGIVAQADVARNIEEAQVGELVEAISR